MFELTCDAEVSSRAVQAKDPLRPVELLKGWFALSGRSSRGKSRGSCTLRTPKLSPQGARENMLREAVV